MLELVQEILTKVAFDKLLFQKELKKGMQWINKEDKERFKEWCYEKFKDQHGEILDIIFKTNKTEKNEA